MEISFALAHKVCIMVGHIVVKSPIGQKSTSQTNREMSRYEKKAKQLVTQFMDAGAHGGEAITYALITAWQSKAVCMNYGVAHDYPSLNVFWAEVIRELRKLKDQLDKITLQKNQ